MLLLLVSVVLGLIPLAGIAWLLMLSDIATVDGLFMSLMLLTISGLFFLNALLEMRHLRKHGGSLAMEPALEGAPGAFAGPAAAAASDPRVRTLEGVVEKFEYFEAPVGSPNKSLVTLRANGASSPRLVMFCGNVREQLRVGQRVRLAYRAGEDCHTLLSWRYK
jgi:hypothetical protein